MSSAPQWLKDRLRYNGTTINLSTLEKVNSIVYIVGEEQINNLTNELEECKHKINELNDILGELCEAIKFAPGGDIFMQAKSEFNELQNNRT